MWEGCFWNNPAFDGVMGAEIGTACRASGRRIPMSFLVTVPEVNEGTSWNVLLKSAVHPIKYHY